MSCFVWCKNEGCRIPTFRCLLCREQCYSEHGSDGRAVGALEILTRSGRYKERFVMKRKEIIAPKDEPLPKTQDAGRTDLVEIGEDDDGGEGIFLLQNGKIRPFIAQDYTASVLYQVVESFAVECRLVRPEEPASLLFEGKRPSKKTVPIIVSKGGESILLDSWEDLESRPEQLADATEVIGATPVKQVFVLRRK